MTLLTDHLPLLAAAPDGIKKLRELILELAVRGKLVPQDEGDEPVCEVLARLSRGNLQLSRKESRHSKDPITSPDMQSRPLSKGWAWARLGEIVHLLDHLRKPVTKQDRKPGDIPYYGASGVVDYVSTYLFDEPLVLVGEDGAKWGRGEGTAFSISGKTWVNNHAHVIRPIRSAIVDEYLVYALVGMDLGSFITGMTVPKLNQAKLISIPIALPPIEEQQRIVAKVDELMSLCDTLEAQQANAESAHAQLVQALLDSLTQASDADDFAASWQRLSEHFDTLFTTEFSISLLRTAVLHLAADGYLVKSTGSAEQLPISELIEGDSLNGCSKKPDDSVGRVEILRINAGTGNDDFLVDEHEHKWVDVPEAQIGKFLLKENDLLACRFNGNLHYVGSFSLYRAARGVKQIFPDKLIRFRADKSKVLPNYLKFVLNAPLARAQIEAFCATTVGNIGISARSLKTVCARIPSIEEQTRIVVRLDELMSLCDRLKTRFRQARALNQQLASTLVERAVA